MKYKWKVVMNNGTVYYVQSEEYQVEGFAKQLLGGTRGSFNIGVFKLVEKTENGENMVAIVGENVSSFEWYSKNQDTE